MVAGGWVTALLAFLGAAAGAAGAYVAAARGIRQRELQGRREEWGRRFSAALDDIASDTFRRRELGRVVLLRLTRSQLATTEEKALADVVLEAGARLDREGEDVVFLDGRQLDEEEFVQEDGNGEGGEP